MSKEKMDDMQLSQGEELLAQAAAALFDDPGQMDVDLLPEEIAEFEELRRSVMEVMDDEYSFGSGDANLSVAAEDECGGDYK